MLLPPLTALGVNAAGQKSLTGGVESLVKALDPFATWDAGDLAAFLKVAQTYRDTGVLPDPVVAPVRGAGRAKGKPAAPKPPKKSVADVVAHLRDLQTRSGDLDPSQVKSEVDALDALTVPQLKEVQKDFLGVVVGKSKPELLAALRKRINEHRSSRDRVNGILA